MTMKTGIVVDALRICVFIVGLMSAFTFCVNGQVILTPKLRGTIYDAQGSVVVKANVMAVNADKKKFETFSNENGEYELVLPFNKYDSSRNFREAVYDISVESPGFTKTVINGYVFIPSQFGTMQLDLALKVGPVNDENHP